MVSIFLVVLHSGLSFLTYLIFSIHYYRCRVFQENPTHVPHVEKHIHKRIDWNNTRKSTQEKENFKCTFCNSTFVSRYNRLRHERAVHSDIKTHKCEHCEEMFASRVASYRHFWHVPTHFFQKSKKIKCQKCNKTRTLRGGFEIREITFTDSLKNNPINVYVIKCLINL